jgi:hypothetical protein
MDAFQINREALRDEQRSRRKKLLLLTVLLFASWGFTPTVLGARPISTRLILELLLNLVFVTGGLLLLSRPNIRLSRIQTFGFLLLSVALPLLSSNSWLDTDPHAKPGLSCASYIFVVGLVTWILGRTILRGTSLRFGMRPVMLIAISVVAVSAGMSAYCAVDSARHLGCHGLGILGAILFAYLVSTQERTFGD